jgi:hypothetical protein
MDHKYNTEFDKNISENTFINRLVGMDEFTIKTINDQSLNKSENTFILIKINVIFSQCGSVCIIIYTVVVNNVKKDII